MTTLQRTPSDWLGNILALVLVLVVNTLSNALPIAGVTMSELSAQFPALFTPAGFTFAIWGLIFLSLVAFVIYQAMPAQRFDAGLRQISLPFKVSCFANAAWVFTWHYGMLEFSLLIMAVLLLSLLAIYIALQRVKEPRNAGYVLFVRHTFSLYTAWICVATIANYSAVEIGLGWKLVAIDMTTWTLFKLALAGALATYFIVRRGDLVFAAVVAWAAIGISVKQAATPAVSASATTLAILVGMLIALESAGKIYRRVQIRRQL